MNYLAEAIKVIVFSVKWYVRIDYFKVTFELREVQKNSISEEHLLRSNLFKNVESST